MFKNNNIITRWHDKHIFQTIKYTHDAESFGHGGATISNLIPSETRNSENVTKLFSVYYKEFQYQNQIHLRYNHGINFIKLIMLDNFHLYFVTKNKILNHDIHDCFK